MEKLDRNYKWWFGVKSDVQRRKTLHDFKEWQIWWCAIGENVGVEINGKGAKFERPIIIHKKFSKLGLMAIPLTTKDHTIEAPDWYVHFRFKGRDEYAAIHQVETISAYRLYRRMGSLDDSDIQRIIDGFEKLYFQKNTPSAKKGVTGKSRIYLHCIKFLRKIKRCFRELHF